MEWVDKMKSYKSIKKIFVRELRLIAKDINIRSVILLAPLFYSFFYGSIYYNKVESNVEIAILDLDNSATTHKITRFFDSHPMLKIVDNISSIDEGNQKLLSEEIKGIIYFPKNFEAKLKNGKPSELKIYLSGTRFLVSNDLNKAINEVIGFTNASISVKYFVTKGNGFEQAKELIQPVKMDIRPMFNFTESYGDFLIPAVFVLILQQTLLIGLSESMAKERESNSIRELNRLANGKPNLIINGKGIFYLILFGSYSLFFVIVNFNIFKIPNRGEFFPIFILSGIMLISVINLTIFLSSFFKRKIISLQFLTLTSYPVFLISGYSWLGQSMPAYLKIISNLIPSTPYFAAYTRITQMGAGIYDVLPEMIHLVILALIGYGLAYFRINHLIKNSYGNTHSQESILKTT